MVGARHPLLAKMRIEPVDLADQTLIIYPVDRSRLDVFTRFLDPRISSPHPFELRAHPHDVAIGGQWPGVSCLPNWAVTEYLPTGNISVRPIGEDGLWCTLYAAIRTDQFDDAFIKDFLKTAHDTCFNHLNGIKRVEPSVDPFERASLESDEC